MEDHALNLQNQKVTADQAADAMAMYLAFVTKDNYTPEQEAWLASVTTTGARYQMLAMAAEAQEVYEALAPEVSDILLSDDDFYKIIVEKFDYGFETETPTLVGTVEETAAEITREIVGSTLNPA